MIGAFVRFAASTVWKAIVPESESLVVYRPATISNGSPW
jgi:hypothetical protein